MIPNFDALTNAQKEAALRLIAHMWDSFAASDDGLLDSTCECCEGKRAIVAEVLSAEEDPTSILAFIEVDANRGVVYAHSVFGGGKTIIRICRLPIPVRNLMEEMLDITYRR